MLVHFPQTQMNIEHTHCLSSLKMSIQLTIPGIIAAHNEQLNKQIIVAKAAESTFTGRGRRAKECRGVNAAPSKEIAAARKARSKRKREMRKHRSNSKERALTRRKSTSCKKGFPASGAIEAQSGIVNAMTGLGNIPDSLEGLMGAVEALGNEASQFNSTMEELTNIVGRYDPKDLSGIKDGINATNATIRDDFVPILDRLTTLMSVFEERTRPSNLREQIKKMMPSKETVANLITVGLILSTLYAMHTQNLPLQALVAGISVLRVLTTGQGHMHAAFAATSAALAGLQEHHADFVPHASGGPEIVAQGALEKPLYAAGTVAIVMALVGITWRKASDIVDAAQQFGEKVKGFDAAQRGWRSFVDACLKGLENVVNFIRNCFGGKPIKLRSDPYFFLEQYVAKVHCLRDQFYSGMRDQSVLHQCNELYAEAEKVINELKSTGGTDLQIRDVVECKRVLNLMMVHLGSMNVYSSGQRITPVTVLMTGAPGIGKTTLMNWAWPVVSSRVLPDDKLEDFRKNRGNFMYSYNQKDQYYSGYKGQQHMLIDEFGFIRDSATGESIFSELIMINNNNPYCLNMAALEDKGRYHFRSKFVWLTTNRETFRPDQMPSIQEPQAVLRRLDFAWCACVKPNWATTDTAHELPQNRRLDKDKLRNYMVNRTKGQPAFPHLVLHKMTSVEWGKLDEREYTVDEFVDSVVQQYESNEREGINMLDMVQEAVDDVIAQRLGIAAPDDEDDVMQMINSDLDHRLEAVAQAKRNIGHAKKLEAQLGAIERELVAQGGERDSTPITQVKDCVCALCHKSPAFGTFVNFRKGLMLNHRFDGRTLTILEKGCKQPKIGLNDFNKIYNDRILYHGQNGWATLPRPEVTEDACISFEAKRDPEHAIQMFADAIMGMRLHTGLFDFSNKNYLYGALTRLTGILMNVTVIYGIAKLLGYLFTMFAQRPSERANGSEPEVRKPTTSSESAYPLRRPIIRARKAGKELGTRGVEDVIKSTVRSNCFRVDCHVPNASTSTTGVISMVQSQVALLPMHIMESWAAAFEKDRGAYLVLKQVFTSSGEVKKDTVAGQNVYLRDVMTIENGECVLDFERVGTDDDDVVIVYLSQVRRGKSVVKHFLSKTYHIPNGSHSYFCGIDKEEYTMVEKTGLCAYAGRVSYSQTGTSHSIMSSYTTRQGDCGALVGVISTPAPQAIYGIHVAGCPRGQPTAYAARVAREDLLEAIEALGKRVHLRVDDVEKCIPPATAEIVVQGGHKGPAGTEPLFHVVSLPRPMKTKLTKSPIFGKIGFECTQQPASLRVYNGVDALEHASMKYNKYVRGIPPHRLDQAKRIVATKLIGLHPPKYRRVLTVPEALRGIAGERFLCGMPRASSPGLPWASMWKGKGKTAAMGTDEEISLDTPEMKKVLFEVEWMLESIRNGQRPTVVFTSFLKDELRPIGKAARLISCAPFHYSILMRQYFLGFSEHVMNNRIINGVAVGISPTSDEWTVLGNKHAKRFCVAGDVGNFDCSMEPNAMRRIKDVIHEFYNDYGLPEYEIREVLFDELIYSRHAFGSAVYEWIGCNPSGNILTVILNSIMTLLMVYSAGHEIADADGDSSIGEIEADTYGDDVLISSDNPAFSFLNFKKVFHKWDIKFTDENKGEEFIDIWTTIHEVTFLKRRFLRLPQHSETRFVAALSMDTILNCVQWMNKTDHTHDDYLNRVHTMLVELAAHGPDVYYRWQRTIQWAAEGTWLERPLEVRAWEERFELFLSSDASY